MNEKQKDICKTLLRIYKNGHINDEEVIVIIDEIINSRKTNYNLNDLHVRGNK